MSNMKSKNSKLVKLFLLGCANAAILTAMPNAAKGDVEIRDIIGKTEEFTKLELQAQLDLIKEKFNQGNIRERTKLTNIRIEIEKQIKNAGGIVNKVALEEVKADNGPKFGVIDGDKFQEGLLNTNDPALTVVKNSLKENISLKRMNNLPTTLERLAYAAVDNDISLNQKKAVISDFLNGAITNQEMGFVLFDSNINQEKVKKTDLKVTYSKIGENPLFKLIKAHATEDQKQVFFEAIENYSKSQIVEQFINIKNPAERKKLLNFANATTFDNFIAVMGEIVIGNLDIDSANTKLNDKGLINRNLNDDEFKALKANFTHANINVLADIIDDKNELDLTKRRDIINSKRLVGMDMNGYTNLGMKQGGPNADHTAKFNDVNNPRKPIYDVAQEIKNLSPKSIEGKLIDEKLANKEGQVYYALHAGRNNTSNNLNTKKANIEADLKDTIRFLLSEQFAQANNGLNDRELATKIIELLTTDNPQVKATAIQMLANLKAVPHVQEIINKSGKVINDADFVDSIFQVDANYVHNLFGCNLDYKHPVNRNSIVTINIPGTMNAEMQAIKLEEIKKLPGAEFEYRIKEPNNPQEAILLNNEGKVYYSYQAEKSKKPENIQNKIIGAERDLSETIKIIVTAEYIEANPNLTSDQILELFTENSVDKEAIKQKSLVIFDRLKVNPHIKEIIGKNKNIADTENFINNLFQDEKGTAIRRFEYKFDRVNPSDAQVIAIKTDPADGSIKPIINISQNIKNNIKNEKDREFKLAELNGYKYAVDRVNYTVENKNYLDKKNAAGDVIESKLDQELKSLSQNFDQLTNEDKIGLLTDINAKKNIETSSPAIKTELKDKLNFWLNNNITHMVINNIFKADINTNKLNQLIINADYELMQNYFAEIVESKKQIFELANLNGEVLGKITEKDITVEMEIALNSLLPVGAKKLNKTQIAKIYNDTNTTKINSIIAGKVKHEAAKNGIRLTGIKPTNAETKRILGALSNNASDFLDRVKQLQDVENTLPKINVAQADRVEEIIPDSITVIGKQYQEFLDNVRGGQVAELGKKNDGTRALNNFIGQELIKRELNLDPNNPINDPAKINDIVAVVEHTLSKNAVSSDFIGPLTEKQQEYKNEFDRINPTNVGVFDRVKQNYNEILVDLAQDPGFVKRYQKIDPKNAAEILAITDEIMINNGDHEAGFLGDFFNLAEETVKREKVEQQRQENVQNQILADAANMFVREENQERIAEINAEAQNRRNARAEERIAIQQRLQEEGRGEFNGIALMFEAAEREAAVRQEERQHELERQNPDRVQIQNQNQVQVQDQNQVQDQEQGQDNNQNQDQPQDQAQGQVQVQDQNQIQDQEQGQDNNQNQDQPQDQAQGQVQVQDQNQGQEQAQRQEHNQNQDQPQDQVQGQVQVQDQNQGQEQAQRQEHNQNQDQPQDQVQGQVEVQDQNQIHDQEQGQDNNQNQGQVQVQNQVQNQDQNQEQDQAGAIDAIKKAEELAKAEKAKEEEKLAAIEKAKRAEEGRITETARVEALEVATMQRAVKEDETIIAMMYHPAHNICQMNSDTIFNRMNLSAVAAGDEDEKVLDKGVWLSVTYGTSKQGTEKGFVGYKGQASGGTIGLDVGSDNYKDLVGIAYTKLDSKFKSSGGKLNTAIDSHIIALYGQKELPKNFMIQAMLAYNHNIIKSKIKRLGTIASGKHKNNNYNFEGLLSYNYLTGNQVTLTPNIGIKYGHIKDGTYQENGVRIQHLSIASKKQHLWTGIVGGSVSLAPQKITSGITITPTLASVENYFNNKSKKLDAKVKWKDKEINQTIVLPKQPKIGYNIGASVLAEKNNISVVFEYNCHLQKKYQSHQGFIKLKVKL